MHYKSTINTWHSFYILSDFYFESMSMIVCRTVVLITNNWTVCVHFLNILIERGEKSTFNIVFCLSVSLSLFPLPPSPHLSGTSVINNLQNQHNERHLHEYLVSLCPHISNRIKKGEAFRDDRVKKKSNNIFALKILIWKSWLLNNYPHLSFFVQLQCNLTGSKNPQHIRVNWLIGIGEYLEGFIIRKNWPILYNKKKLN